MLIEKCMSSIFLGSQLVADSWDAFCLVVKRSGAGAGIE